MSSKLKLISSALLLLGDKPTNTLGDDAPNSVKSAEVLYDIYYPVILSERVWRFAVKQAPLSKISGPPKVANWAYAYELPEDYLLISHLQPDREFEIIGNYLYTNLNNTDSLNPPTLFYTYKVDEGVLPSYFEAYLVERLASLFAMKITNEPSITQLWAQSAELRKRDAIALDNQSQTSQTLPGNIMVEAHYGVDGWLGIRNT
jgi:hypothetical protein